MEQTVAWEAIASGYGLIEGPTIDVDDSLVFADVLDGGVYRLTAGGAVSTVVPKRRGVGGIAVHADGGLVIGGRDLQFVRDSSVLLHAIDGALGVNDFCADAAGRIYVGSVRWRSLDPTAEHVPGELWRIDLDGSATVLYDAVQQCNGVRISPNGATIYHSDTRARCLIVHDLSADGAAATNRRHWSTGDRSHPDGIAIDTDGGVWVADHGGSRVIRLRPDSGEIDRVIAVPTKYVTSLCFWGSDLVVVGADNLLDPPQRGSVFRANVGVTGALVPLAAVRPVDPGQ